MVLGQVAQELVAADGPLAVLLLALADEGDNVVVAFRVLDVLLVEVRRLQRVVLDADEVVDDVVRRCDCFPWLPLLSRGDWSC